MELYCTSRTPCSKGWSFSFEWKFVFVSKDVDQSFEARARKHFALGFETILCPLPLCFRSQRSVSWPISLVGGQPARRRKPFPDERNKLMFAAPIFLNEARICAVIIWTDLVNWITPIRANSVQIPYELRSYGTIARKCISWAIWNDFEYGW